MNKYDRADIESVAALMDTDKSNDWTDEARTLRRIAQDTDEYNGWTNRETWAVALHINNDQGWQESVLEAVREADREPDTDDLHYRASVAGDIIRENVEQLLTVDGYAEMTGEDHLPAALSRVAEDVGSLYRVNWTELGRSFLSDLEDQA